MKEILERTFAVDENTQVDSEVYHSVSKTDPHVCKETYKYEKRPQKETSERTFAVDENSEVYHFVSKKTHTYEKRPTKDF